ncbi:N-acetylneuraminate cytidylyltransferase [Rothia aeria]|uniref:N-acetylneuraminate cytidylyltransferase n=1 Tax=Rothia aeria TaxID=172042 RepID=A0A2Z5QY65_9MICC|nr:N-acetylneuraminate cytidylyltransferase [Rothia aeria]
MRILCVIPVRGGSKGIPRKNLREIAGKPLVAWTILQALAARDELAGEHELRVVVSTDDQELAAIARQYGAEVPFMRPAHLAEDTTATEPVIEHAIDFYTGRAGHRRRSCCCRPPARCVCRALSRGRYVSSLRTAKTQWWG